MDTIRLPTSRKLLERAQRRILDIAKRDDLTTTDPLMAEIALAQVTATMALAQGIQEIKEQLKPITKIEVQRTDPFAQSTTYAANRRIRELDQMISRLESGLMGGLIKPASPPSHEQHNEPKPWWRRF